MPLFRSGDTLRVHVRVKEGDKERTQVFEGVCIRRRGNGSSESFTVRKVSYGVGVERIFPVQGPVVEKVEIKSRGHVRRSRLYYLRDLRGQEGAAALEDPRSLGPAGARRGRRAGGRRGRGSPPGLSGARGLVARLEGSLRGGGRTSVPAASRSHATTSKRTAALRCGCAASHAAAPCASRLRLRKSTASSGRPAPRERRVFTSTNASVRPRVVTRSISTRPARTLRARIRQPRASRYAAARASPSMPSARRSSGASPWVASRRCMPSAPRDRGERGEASIGRALGTLYLVATPIGNLEDVTLRALRVLREADRVYAEDTRRTRVLLDRHAIGARPRSLHEHNEEARIAEVLAALADGQQVALVSDAGTPLVSDPGARLVVAAIHAGHAVVPVPGASAPLAALVASGLPAAPFTFLGFLPRKAGERDRLLARFRDRAETLVLFESPQRLAATLRALAAALGDRRASVARELTKVHEEHARGSLGELAERFADGTRGEVTIVVAGADSEAAAAPVLGDDAAIDARIASLAAQGLRAKEIATAVAAEAGIPKRDAYARVVAAIRTARC